MLSVQHGNSGHQLVPSKNGKNGSSSISGTLGQSLKLIKGLKLIKAFEFTRQKGRNSCCHAGALPREVLALPEGFVEKKTVSFRPARQIVAPMSNVPFEQADLIPLRAAVSHRRPVHPRCSREWPAVDMMFKREQLGMATDLFWQALI
ncbi:MAG: hypothetical protein KGL62_17765 [Bradyrhizobium sp.]|uniref:hypothetical protein n=1 Tax=Bradyrhizobium sp. TaxID=376 RepID=UPI00239BEB6A|nr:hypothetical protein [Bradyrhizobium sp.]MDE2604188.1 hypothetical protein [Bradyrhizobium sp.]